MRFDVILGNPPYNNDLYVNFVLNSFDIYEKYMLFITPAKWQAKGGKLNDQFREKIVPYMSKIVFYPYCVDVFDIWEADGISYYLIDKVKHDTVEITNKCSVQKLFNSTGVTRDIRNKKSLFNCCDAIINKMGAFEQYSFYNNRDGRYQVYINGMSSGGGLFSMANGSMHILSPPICIDKNNNTNESKKTTISQLAFASDDKDKCINFIRYAYSKFTRFMIMAGLSKLSNIIGDETWRFVPDPQDWTVIYEDNPLDGYITNSDGIYIDNDGNKHCSLYIKYKLNIDEINIIESVIKERNLKGTI